jgi:Flp pilus assembly protein TadB
LILNGVHNKTLIMDDNWLSAVRTAGGTHQREERSIVVEGGGARSMIIDEIEKLEKKDGGIATIRSDLPESAKARVPDKMLEDNAKSAAPSRLARFVGLAGAWTFLVIVVGGMFKAAGVAMALLLTFVVGPIWVAWRFLRVPVTFK